MLKTPPTLTEAAIAFVDADRLYRALHRRRKAHCKACGCALPYDYDGGGSPSTGPCWDIRPAEIDGNGYELCDDGMAAVEWQGPHARHVRAPPRPRS
jgi:hypothetical protein